MEIVTTPQRIAQRFSEILEAKTPIAALRAVTALRRDLDAFERQQVARALADGATFASIARELGISRQAVHRRFRNLSPADAPLVTSPDARRVLLPVRLGIGRPIPMKRPVDRHRREAGLGREPPAEPHDALAALVRAAAMAQQDQRRRCARRVRGEPGEDRHGAARALDVELSLLRPVHQLTRVPLDRCPHPDIPSPLRGEPKTLRLDP